MSDGMYYLATMERPAAQALPPVFAGRYDLGALGDTELACIGWVRAAPPTVDPDFERVAVAFAEGEDGWQATYSVVPVDLDVALTNAFRILADRAWRAEVGGMMFNGAPIPTDREVTQPRAISVGIAAQNDPDLTVTNWKLAPGVFLTLDNARLIELGKAMSAHVQARFDREAAISKLLLAKKKTESVRATLAEELDKGWPA
nr:DUF4376 domain-containing protein [Methylobacterium sp. OTU13CASTA1]